jgi:hypothetical protein
MAAAQANLATLAAQMQANPTCKVVIIGAGNASKISYTSAVSGSYSFTNNITPAGAPNVIGTFGFSHPGQGSVANVFNYLHFGADAEL